MNPETETLAIPEAGPAVKPRTPSLGVGVTAGLQLAEMRAAKARTGQKVATAVLDALQEAAEEPRSGPAAIETIQTAYNYYLIETGAER